MDANQTTWHLHRNHLVSVPDLQNAALPPQRVPNSSSAEGGPALNPACPLARKITLGVVWLGFSAAAQALVGLGWKGTSNSMSAADSVLLLQGGIWRHQLPEAAFIFPAPWLEAEPGEHRGEGQREGRKMLRKKAEKAFAGVMLGAKKGIQQTQTRVCSARFTPHSLKRYDAMLKTPDWHRKY